MIIKKKNKISNLTALLFNRPKLFTFVNLIKIRINASIEKKLIKKLPRIKEKNKPKNIY
jgi:hypothetical protein